jgi:hypothetical protein
MTMTQQFLTGVAQLVAQLCMFKEATKWSGLRALLPGLAAATRAVAAMPRGRCPQPTHTQAVGVTGVEAGGPGAQAQLLDVAVGQFAQLACSLCTVSAQSLGDLHLVDKQGQNERAGTHTASETAAATATGPVLSLCAELSQTSATIVLLIAGRECGRGHQPELGRGAARTAAFATLSAVCLELVVGMSRATDTDTATANSGNATTDAGVDADADARHHRLRLVCREVQATALAACSENASEEEEVLSSSLEVSDGSLPLYCHHDQVGASNSSSAGKSLLRFVDASWGLSALATTVAAALTAGLEHASSSDLDQDQDQDQDLPQHSATNVDVPGESAVRQVVVDVLRALTEPSRPVPVRAQQPPPTTSVSGGAHAPTARPRPKIRFTITRDDDDDGDDAEHQDEDGRPRKRASKSSHGARTPAPDAPPPPPRRHDGRAAVRVDATPYGNVARIICAAKFAGSVVAATRNIDLTNVVEAAAAAPADMTTAAAVAAVAAAVSEEERALRQVLEAVCRGDVVPVLRSMCCAFTDGGCRDVLSAVVAELLCAQLRRPAAPGQDEMLHSAFQRLAHMLAADDGSDSGSSSGVGSGSGSDSEAFGVASARSILGCMAKVSKRWFVRFLLRSVWYSTRATRRNRRVASFSAVQRHYHNSIIDNLLTDWLTD